MASLFPPEEVVPSAVDTLPEYDKSFEFDIPLLSTVDDIADASASSFSLEPVPIVLSFLNTSISTAACLV